MTTIWLAIGLALLSFLGYRAIKIWLDTGRRETQPARRVVWALTGALFPDRYWWEARIEQMSAKEKQDLLAHGTGAWGPSSADSLHCPLCGSEVSRAWTLAVGGQPTVARGPIECPACDFRLDACRHYAHFLAGVQQNRTALLGLLALPWAPATADSEPVAQGDDPWLL